MSTPQPAGSAAGSGLRTSSCCRYCGGSTCGTRSSPSSTANLVLAQYSGDKMSRRHVWRLALRRAAQAVRSRATRKVLPSLMTDRTVLTLLLTTLVFDALAWWSGLCWLLALVVGPLGAFAVNVVQHAVEIRKRTVFSARDGACSASWLINMTAAGDWQAHGLTGTRGSGVGLALLDAARHDAPPGTTVSSSAANARLATRYRELGFTDGPSRTRSWGRLADRLWPPLRWTRPQPSQVRVRRSSPSKALFYRRGRRRGCRARSGRGGCAAG